MAAIIGMIIHDPLRILPPDDLGRPRFIDKQGYSVVRVGKDHPLNQGNGWQREGRVVLFELGKLFPGEKAVHLDGNGANCHPDNLVAWDGRPPAPWAKEHPEVKCLCGCGTTLPWRRKWVKGHKRAANPFDHLPVTRERKRQLWNQAKGLCARCGRVRTRHPSMCAVCLERREIDARERREAYYRDNRDHCLARARDWGQHNRIRQAEYQNNMRLYGRKRQWPKDIREAWDAKYPTAGQRHISQLGLR
jgi:hypothetical protein